MSSKSEKTEKKKNKAIGIEAFFEAAGLKKVNKEETLPGDMKITMGPKVPSIPPGAGIT